MEIGMLHLHRLTVILYFILILVLAMPLLLKKRNLFITFRAKAKWIRMAMDFLLLGTGVFLLIKSPVGTSAVMMVKYGLIILAMLLLVFGLKKYNYHFLLAGLLVWIYIYGVSKTHHIFLKPYSEQTANITEGKELYNILCMRCHGEKGDAKFIKAADLRTSPRSDMEIKGIIKNGKKLMPSFEYLSDEQIEALTRYVKELRK